MNDRPANINAGKSPRDGGAGQAWRRAPPARGGAQTRLFSGLK